MAPLTEQTLNALRYTVDTACYDHCKGIPGTTVVVVNKDGDELFAHAAGRRGMASAEQMTLDSVYWIASCTKMITGVAVMQLVEKGQLKLDDGDQLEELCPELKTMQVLRMDGTLEKKKKQITLRMLLTHTAGFGYSFFNVRLRDWGLPAGIDEFSGRFEDMVSPLLFQPGEGWEYGVGIDWAGIALERATGEKLNDYMRKNIFEPLGIENMSMIPTQEMKSNMAFMNYREIDGTLRPRDHLARLPLVVSTKEEAERTFNSGGGGMFGQPREYCKILAVLLSDGKCPKNGAEILKPSTVAEMFTNQIPDFPDFGRQAIPAAKPDQTNPVPELYPVPGNPPQGWGLTFMISGGGATGRSRNTAHWAGLANCWWWADREHGVAGIIATQILPFADFPVLKLWAEIEKEVYVGISAAHSGN
ncbi:beta-lactamase family protein [Diaporthe helianthi]|uniref:Beta-lactamase family protein n=1 Tax=Diaporthe helianthi TaxID=158607 RepID=A0A2P5HEN9_DIAHE|nr:beta-lactamase family protein [Diaporthe helianthi]